MSEHDDPDGSLTPVEFVRKIIPGITDEECRHILWDMTPYPFVSVPMLRDYVNDVKRALAKGMSIERLRTWHYERNDRRFMRGDRSRNIAHRKERLRRLSAEKMERRFPFTSGKYLIPKIARIMGPMTEAEG